MVPRLVDCCVFFISARLRTLCNASVDQPINHKGYNPLWKSPTDPEIEKPLTSVASFSPL
jgi:hypothetical protein